MTAPSRPSNVDAVGTEDALTIFVVTGQSGAGKSTALRALEDLGYFCVDNLPSALAPELVRVAEQAGAHGLAFGVDVRLGLLGSAGTSDPKRSVGTSGEEAIRGAGKVIDDLRAQGRKVRVLFCTASEEALVRRFSETRRPHPVGTELALLDAIRREQELLATLRVRADLVLDTSRLTVHDLRRQLLDTLAPSGGPRPMVTRVLSFGFKYGIPVDADLVFDVRFLPNPHFVPALKPRTGRDPEVARFVLEASETQELLSSLTSLLSSLLPRYEREGKALLTIAIGCTGGKHRSVAVAEALAARLHELLEPARKTSLVVHHRDAEHP
ncbi:MAG: RNase adapter RapZ [Deltaproteobacteria bacterium]|nr:RNase adapter RapZ [Deltaproteobacteria bacterium]